MPLHIIRQDITKMNCDAIVNPSNEDLIPGGGVDAAIHEVAGPKLLKACQKVGGCPIGEARLTKAYNLQSKYIIHTAGPVWCGGDFNEQEKLESCYRSCLAIAKEKHFESVAFPLISSGIYGFPKDRVLKIAINIISEFLFENEMTVYVVVFDKTAYEFSGKLFSDITSYIDDNYAEEHSDEASKLCQIMSVVDKRVDECEDEHIEKLDRSKRLFGGRRTYSSRRISREEEEAYAETEIESLPLMEPCTVGGLDEWVKSLDESFAQALFRLIDEKGMSDVECYKKANIDKRTFSKIKSNSDYKPSKVTVISFAIALELTIEETQHLLRTVGLSLSRSNKFDIIIEYFITNRVYDIFAINEALFEFDQVCLGVMA